MNFCGKCATPLTTSTPVYESTRCQQRSDPEIWHEMVGKAYLKSISEFIKLRKEKKDIAKRETQVLPGVNNKPVENQ